MSLQTRIKAAGAAAAAAPVDAGRRRAVKRRTKRAVMDRMGYDEVARISAYVDPALARSELRPAVEAALNVEEPTDLATPERETIIDEILDDVVGLGPLQPLIEDDTVTEIMINGCRSAFFERSGVLYPIEHAFEDDEQIRVLIDRIISPLGRRIDERSPIVNARLKTGYRVNAVIPPVAIDGPILTIRKFSDRICSLDELVGLGSLPLWYAQLLSCAVSLRQDLAVAGGTGSGKTTLLNGDDSRPGDQCFAHAPRPHRRGRGARCRVLRHAAGHEHGPRRLAHHAPCGYRAGDRGSSDAACALRHRFAE